MKSVLIYFLSILPIAVFPAVIWIGCHYNNWVVIIAGIIGFFAIKIESHVETDNQQEKSTERKEKKKKITVQFKETYNDHPVTRTCVNMTLEQVIKVYGLREPGIEWWKVIDEK